MHNKKFDFRTLSPRIPCTLLHFFLCLFSFRAKYKHGSSNVIAKLRPKTLQNLLLEESVLFEANNIYNIKFSFSIERTGHFLCNGLRKFDPLHGIIKSCHFGECELLRENRSFCLLKDVISFNFTSSWFFSPCHHHSKVLSFVDGDSFPQLWLNILSSNLQIFSKTYLKFFLFKCLHASDGEVKLVSRIWPS